MARPYFRYYGSKYKGARHYGPPRRELVIEPFAGSACYSTYWDHPNVALYDLGDEVCAAWDWLISCSEDDIRRIPEVFHTNDEFQALPLGPRQIVYWFIIFGECERARHLPPRYLELVNTGVATGAWGKWVAEARAKGKTGTDMELVSTNSWGPNLKDRLIRQKPLLKGWSITQGSYADIPMREAHWHVDPPYQGAPGRKYIHSDIDFSHLGDWCKALPGAVDVCENEGADWLPFRPLYTVVSSGRNQGEAASRSVEVVWQKAPLHEDLFGWD